MKQHIKQSVFFLARLLGLFALARRFTRGQVRILCYHGGCIGDEDGYNAKLFCRPALLAARMAWLQRHGFNLVPLGAAVQAARGGARAPLTTAITFDDGWYTTASELVPVLARMGIPSTLYLCTRQFLEQGPVPSVAVHYLLWKTRLSSATVAGIGAGADGHWDLSTPAARDRLGARASAAIEAAEGERAPLLARLADCLGVDAGQLQLDSRRFDYMNGAELLALPAQGCAIELHGHVHRYPAGDAQAFRADLAACSAAIVAQGLPQPRHYCYPSGNFDAGASAVLAEQGVLSATTCLPGLVDTVSAAQAHYLPRFLDGAAISELEFEAEMSGFTGLLRTLLRGGSPASPAPAALAETEAQSQRA